VSPAQPPTTVAVVMGSTRRDPVWEQYLHGWSSNVARAV
jgi:hypothetical protein